MEAVRSLKAAEASNAENLPRGRLKTQPLSFEVYAMLCGGQKEKEYILLYSTFEKQTTACFFQVKSTLFLAKQLSQHR